jgi:L-histidine N-alpha-methyltransferase
MDDGARGEHPSSSDANGSNFTAATRSSALVAERKLECRASGTHAMSKPRSTMPQTSQNDARHQRLIAPPSSAAFDATVLAGLKRRPKRLPSAYLYDQEGSRLFQRIMALPEYYLSRAEAEILTEHAAQIAMACAGRRVVLVDLGAGDGSKTSVLLDALVEACDEVTYAPVDICAEALAALEAAHAVRHPRVPVTPFVADYAHGLAAVGKRFPGHVRVALFLGSNIGNLPPEEAVALLTAWRRALRPGDHLLLGLDLVKDPAVLQAAYDDSEGVTAAFNLNLLTRMNRELGADFEPSSFRHFARYDPRRNAMESYLVSTRDQLVRVGGECIGFGAWEAIHTETSCKYRESDVTFFAKLAGLSPVGWFYDSRRWFLDALLRAD